MFGSRRREIIGESGEREDHDEESKGTRDVIFLRLHSLPRLPLSLRDPTI